MRNTTSIKHLFIQSLECAHHITHRFLLQYARAKNQRYQQTYMSCKKLSSGRQNACRKNPAAKTAGFLISIHSNFKLFCLVANIDHTALYRSDLYYITALRRMYHLPVSYVNTTVGGACTNITRLRIAHLRPAHECVRRTKSCVTSCQAVAYKS